jgi:hypothetical protein
MIFFEQGYPFKLACLFLDDLKNGFEEVSNFLLNFKGTKKQIWDIWCGFTFKARNY